jgi:hypothetical protein
VAGAAGSAVRNDMNTLTRKVQADGCPGKGFASKGFEMALDTVSICVVLTENSRTR